MGAILYQFASIFDFDGMKSWKYLRTKEDTPSLISKNIALDMINTRSFGVQLSLRKGLNRMIRINAINT